MAENVDHFTLPEMWSSTKNFFRSGFRRGSNKSYGSSRTRSNNFQFTNSSNRSFSADSSGGIFRFKAVRYGFFIFPVITLGLGVWQTRRLQWKLGLIEERERGMSSPPIPLPDDAENPEKQELLAYHPMFVSGRFVHSEEMHVVPRTYKGKNGAHVITPFVTTDGKKILVNRGWVPMDHLDRSTRTDGLPTGTVRPDSLLRKSSGKKGSYVAENVPGQGKWYWVDVKGMAEHTNSTPLMLDAAFTGEVDKYPIGGQGLVELTNPHLNYAITWYSLTAFLTFFCWRIASGRPLTKAANSLLSNKPRF